MSVVRPPPPRSNVTPRVVADATTEKPSSAVKEEKSKTACSGRQPMGRRCVFPMFNCWPLARPKTLNAAFKLARPVRSF